MCVECFCFAAWPDDDDAAAAADDDVVGTGWCADDGDGDNLFHFGDFLCFFSYRCSSWWREIMFWSRKIDVGELCGN